MYMCCSSKTKNIIIPILIKRVVVVAVAAAVALVAVVGQFVIIPRWPKSWSFSDHNTKIF